MADQLMSLVERYVLARIVENASVPTKSQRDSSWCVASHDRARAESERLAAQIRAAIADLERRATTTATN